MIIRPDDDPTIIRLNDNLICYVSYVVAAFEKVDTMLDCIKQGDPELIRWPDDSCIERLPDNRPITRPWDNPTVERNIDNPTLERQNASRF
jgi:hypothetical protein